MKDYFQQAKIKDFLSGYIEKKSDKITQIGFDRKRILQKLDFLEYGEEYFLQKQKIFSENNGFEANDRDVIWDIFNEALLKSKNFYVLKMTYFHIALMLLEEGKNFFIPLQESRKMILNEYKSKYLYKNVKILTAKENSCLKCNQLEGKILSIDEAIEKMPIPHSRCEHEVRYKLGCYKGWCRCLYIINDSVTERIKNLHEKWEKAECGKETLEEVMEREISFNGKVFSQINQAKLELIRNLR